MTGLVDRLLRVVDGPAGVCFAIDGVGGEEAGLFDVCLGEKESELFRRRGRVERGGGDFDFGKNKVAVLCATRAGFFGGQGVDPKSLDRLFLCFDCDGIGIFFRGRASGRNQEIVDLKFGVKCRC